MLRKLALCAGLVLAVSLTGCANPTSTATAEETSVGYDANAKHPATGECSAEKAAACAEKKAECSAEAKACCTEMKKKEGTTQN